MYTPGDAKRIHTWVKIWETISQVFMMIVVCPTRKTEYRELFQCRMSRGITSPPSIVFLSSSLVPPHTNTLCPMAAMEWKTLGAGAPGIMLEVCYDHVLGV